MTYTKNKNIKNAFVSYSKSTNYCLCDCYGNFSQAKENAMEYCKNLMQKLNGYGLKIIGFNSMTFSVGFIGEIPDNKTGEIKKVFCYITRDYDRYIFIEDLPYSDIWQYGY